MAIPTPEDSSTSPKCGKHWAPILGRAWSGPHSCDPHTSWEPTDHDRRDTGDSDRHRGLEPALGQNLKCLSPQPGGRLGLLHSCGD